VSVRGPVWVIVVAAGSGARFGAPKQYEPLGDRRVLDWSLDVARSAADGVVLVVPEDHDTPEEVDVVVTGGDTRSASVRAGLAAVPDDAAVVVVHDAARPAASPELFDAVIEAVLAGADGALPGLAVVDTVKRVQDGHVVETLDRTELVTVQTPQAFRAAALRAAHAGGGDATDDGALVEAAGGRVVVVPGDPRNVKVTSPADLTRLQEVLA
jgi:2-C-methyl-D-erythritol 4-phosphate cytidylyltransferase